MSHTILVVDDEEAIRGSLRGILEDEGYLVRESPSGEACLQLLTKESVSAVLLDIWMAGMDGIETLRRIREQDEELPVIMMSGHGTVETAVAATKVGAYDFLEKPLSLDRVLLLLERAIRELNLLRENKLLKAQMPTSQPLIGHSPTMLRLKEQIARLAPTDGWVLITGEHGTGKEIAARAIHSQSRRQHGPFIAVNSAAIPEEMIESELFGHEQGAFTNAQSGRTGRFEQASGGTLFLDEIADMSLKTQARILRTLETQKFERIGGNRRIQVDVRVIAASNKDLKAEIYNQRFREDLYYRLNVIPIELPPLRDRVEDIPLLIDHFMRAMSGGAIERPFAPETLQLLQAYDWPGNVRELKNLVERLLIMAPGPTIQPNDLPHFLSASKNVSSDQHPMERILHNSNFREAREMFEREFLKVQLDMNGGNISRTADVIGMERSALHRKLKALGLS